MMFVNKFKKIHHNKQIRIKINLCYLFKKTFFMPKNTVMD